LAEINSIFPTELPLVSKIDAPAFTSAFVTFVVVAVSVFAAAAGVAVVALELLAGAALVADWSLAARGAAVAGAVVG
jgi:hypothetical protein